MANYNVSVMLFCRENPVKNTHHKDVKVVLVHPNGSQYNKSTYIKAHFKEGQSVGYGNAHWMSAEEFLIFFNDIFVYGL